jgi:hypothetical protein
MRRTAITYLAVSALCILIDKVYALFGHGVHSAAMSLMFLYPLLAGMLPFLLMGLFLPRADQVRHYRPCFNCYNSGIAALTCGSLLQGIFEIAGTSSPYLPAFYLAGSTLFMAGLLAYLLNLSRRRRAQRLEIAENVIK